MGVTHPRRRFDSLLGDGIGLVIGGAGPQRHAPRLRRPLLLDPRDDASEDAESSVCQRGVDRLPAEAGGGGAEDRFRV